jgi:hypothetical protein
LAFLQQDSFELEIIPFVFNAVLCHRSQPG